MKEVCYLRFFSDGESAANGADDVAAQDVVNVDEVVDADHRQVQRKAEVAIAGCLKILILFRLVLLQNLPNTLSSHCLRSYGLVNKKSF